jgi:hypothetical protein
MERDTLLAILDNLEDITVKPNGEVYDENADEIDTDELENAIGELEETIARIAQLRKVLAWAKLAPMRAEVTTA